MIKVTLKNNNNNNKNNSNINKNASSRIDIQQRSSNDVKAKTFFFKYNFFLSFLGLF